MKYFKKISTYSIITLLFISIYMDISSTESIMLPQQHNNQIIFHFHVIKEKTTEGDTALSKIENINQNTTFEKINIEQMIGDFLMLNKGVDPYDLKPGEYYYFPKYSME